MLVAQNYSKITPYMMKHFVLGEQAECSFSALTLLFSGQVTATVLQYFLSPGATQGTVAKKLNKQGPKSFFPTNHSPEEGFHRRHDLGGTLSALPYWGYLM